MKLKSLTAAIAAMVLMSACSMDPVYQRPASPVPASFAGDVQTTQSAQGAAVATTASPDVLSDWKSFFKDPYLQKLIELTLANNRDLRQAALKVAEYEAEYRIARSNLAPTVTATASNTKSHSLGATSQTSSVELGASSWEVDFFGRLRSLKSQALEEYLSTDAARLSTQLSLVSTTATDYLTWLSDRSLLNIAERTVESDQQTYETTLQSAKLGSGAEEDVQSARTTLASAKSSAAAYRRAVQQDLNNLVAAIGCPLPDGFPQDRELQDDMLFADVPAGLSSDLLTRRPDIVEAEHTLKSANAYVGAARAAFFPTISLTAEAGTASSSLTKLFKAGTGAWSFAPSVSVPIFNYGNLKASLDVAKITKNIDIAAYEETIQTAFKEVSNGLAGRTTYVDQVAADREYVDAAQKYYDIAQARYRAGLDGFLTLLTAQRTLFAAQTQLVTDRLAQQSNLITLYTALGGGWTADDVVNVNMRVL
jgi:outer membrane protein, multidrug efflux system